MPVKQVRSHTTGAPIDAATDGIFPSDGLALPINRTSLSGQAYQHIKSLLMQGRLPPGQPISFRDAARSLTMSVTPVREALLQLVGEKVLVAAKGRTIAVPPLSAAHCREIWDLRLLLEGHCAEIATANATPALVARLQQCHDRMAAAKQRKDVRGGIRHNMAFHFALYEAAAAPTLKWMIDCVWAQSGCYADFFLTSHIMRRNVATTQGPHMHATIIAALAARDRAGVRRGVERDLIEIRDGAIKLLDEQGADEV
jgi:DNA-binding GntR family transcriptional regulator